MPPNSSGYLPFSSITHLFLTLLVMFRPRGALLEPLHAGPATLLMGATSENQSNPEMELGAFDHISPCQKCRSSSISEVSYGTIRFFFFILLGRVVVCRKGLMVKVGATILRT